MDGAPHRRLIDKDHVAVAQLAPLLEIRFGRVAAQLNELDLAPGELGPAKGEAAPQRAGRTEQVRVLCELVFLKEPLEVSEVLLAALERRRVVAGHEVEAADGGRQVDGDAAETERTASTSASAARARARARARASARASASAGARKAETQRGEWAARVLLQGAQKVRGAAPGEHVGCEVEARGRREWSRCHRRGEH